MRFTAICIVLLLTACSTQNLFECPDLKRMGRQAEFTTFKDPSGNIVASGRHLDDGWHVDARLPPWQNVIPIGIWTTWYPNGQMRGRVSYALSCYIQCCTIGPCPNVHAYPVGEFEFWHSNGALKARGAFVPFRQHVETGCEGGDSTTMARPSPASRGWDEKGNEIPLDMTVIKNELLPKTLSLYWPE
jgi:hypothetical protein